MPSRLLWFLIGAGSASWWMMSKDRDFNRRHWGHCRRVDYPSAPRDSSNDTAAAPGAPGPNDSGSNQSRPHPWQTREHWDWRWHQRSRQENNGSSQSPWGASDERFDEMTKQASEAMTELTEVTLDTVFTTAQALKVKLAEYRAEKERQQKELDANREEARRSPPRLV